MKQRLPGSALFDSAANTQHSSCLAKGHPVRRGGRSNDDRRLYWIIRRSLSSGAHSRDPVVDDDKQRVTPYFTTAAVCPNSSLRSSSVRIAGWPKFGLTSFALA
jgi:hypothetical protein